MRYSFVSSDVWIDNRKVRLCGIVPDSWNLGISTDEILELLRSELGCEILSVNISVLTRSTLGRKYKRGASQNIAPLAFDCSSLSLWVYSKMGVLLPRYAIDQREVGQRLEGLNDLAEGDLVFTQGSIGRFYEDRSDDVGHLGIFTDSSTIIHAKNVESGVVEEDPESFIGSMEKFRGATRIIPSAGFYTVQVPDELEVNYSDDLAWKVGNLI